MLSPRSVVLISTFEKSGGGCANTGPDNTMMVATTAIPILFIPAPLRQFSDVLAQDCIGADRDRQAPPMDGGARAPYAVSIQRLSAEFNGHRAQEETNVMTSPIAGGVDCDLHPAVPHLTSLVPYMNDYWRDQVTTRGMTDLVSQSYPPNSPITSRPDWRPAKGKPGSDLDDMKAQALNRFGIHAGSNYHNPPTSVGWGSYHIEDYVAQAQAFQTQLTSLIVEGVFVRHPNLKMVMLESGFTWLPSYLWRLHKFWRGIRMETPWVDRAPQEIVRSNIRFSLQPIDAPPDPATLNRLFDHMQSDELLLFATARSRPRPFMRRRQLPIAISIRRVRPKPSCIRISQSAGARISRPTTGTPIRA